MTKWTKISLLAFALVSHEQIALAMEDELDSNEITVNKYSPPLKRENPTQQKEFEDITDLNTQAKILEVQVNDINENILKLSKKINSLPHPSQLSEKEKEPTSVIKNNKKSTHKPEIKVVEENTNSQWKKWKFTLGAGGVALLETAWDYCNVPHYVTPDPYFFVKTFAFRSLVYFITTHFLK